MANNVKRYESFGQGLKKYIINVTETSYGYIEVEASSPEEAEELAQEVYNEGNTNWGKMDVHYEPPVEA